MGINYTGELYNTTVNKLAEFIHKTKGVRTLDTAPAKGKRVMICNLAMFDIAGITNVLNGLSYGVAYYIIINGTKYPMVKTGTSNFRTSLNIGKTLP